MHMEYQGLSSFLQDKGIKNALLLNAFQELPEDLLLYNASYPYTYQKSNVGSKLETIEPRVIVIAKMLEKLNIAEGENILVIGVDSVFILAALSKIYRDVYMVQTLEPYFNWTKKVLTKIGIQNVHIKMEGQELGWKSEGPFDTILIASELEAIPLALKEQLKIGGKLLVPIGPDWTHSIFEMFQRVSENRYLEEKLRDNFFIPNPKVLPEIGTKAFSETEIIHHIKAKAIAFDKITAIPIDALLSRIGEAKVVLLGEASHGTSEFYLARQEITKALIEKKGFNFVSVEADWSDAEQINSYVRNKHSQIDLLPFSRFPQWMWKNREVLEFVEWLKKYNTKHKNKVGFYGLDLYGMEHSIRMVINYLEHKDTNLARLAKTRYACMRPYLMDPAIYGKMVLSKQLASCEHEILTMLVDLLKNKGKLNHSPEYFYAYQNANVVVDAEKYYKVMYYGSSESWNLRDFHMFHTLKSLLSYFGSETKAIVWAHNSHIGNALATEMYSRGEINIGHLCKEHFQEDSYHIGFGTHSGSVAAAHHWGEDMDVITINTSLPNSYEYLFHKTGIKAFLLPLKEKDSGKKLRELLNTPKLERAIGVIYRPNTERMSHYFHAVLPAQFDEYIWFDTTNSVTPISTGHSTPKLVKNHPLV